MAAMGGWAALVIRDAGREPTRPARIARRSSSALAQIAALTGRGVEPDAHEVARGRVREDLVRSSEPGLEPGPGRLAAGGSGGRPVTIVGLVAIADPLDQRAHH